MNKVVAHYARLVGTAIGISIFISLIVLVIGWLRHWQTTVQFSNGFFVAGAITFVIGLFSVLGGFSMRSDFKVLYSQSAGDMSLIERSKLWIADITQGYGSLVFLTISSVLLVGIAILFGRTSG